MQNHGLDEERIVVDGVKRLSADTGIPLVATNDVHYVRQQDAEIQQVLICIATNHILGEDTGLEFHSDDFYLKSESEMSELFRDTPSAIENTQKIADACNFDFEFGNTKRRMIWTTLNFAGKCATRVFTKDTVNLCRKATLTALNTSLKP